MLLLARTTRATHKSAGFLFGLVFPYIAPNIEVPSFFFIFLNFLNKSIMIIMYNLICDLFESEIILTIFIEMPRKTMFKRFIYIRER